MLIAEFNAERHYEQLCKMWESHEWFPCPIDAIPKTSYIAKRNGSIIAFMAMYVDKGTIGVIDWAVANMEFCKDERDEALKILFEYLVKMAKSLGCNYIYSVTKNNKWGIKMKSYGMVLAENGASTYIMPIGNNTNIAFISD